MVNSPGSLCGGYFSHNRRMNFANSPLHLERMFLSFESIAMVKCNDFKPSNQFGCLGNTSFYLLIILKSVLCFLKHCVLFQMQNHRASLSVLTSCLFPPKRLLLLIPGAEACVSWDGMERLVLLSWLQSSISCQG